MLLPSSVSRVLMAKAVRRDFLSSIETLLAALPEVTSAQWAPARASNRAAAKEPTVTSTRQPRRAESALRCSAVSTVVRKEWVTEPSMAT